MSTTVTKSIQRFQTDFPWIIDVLTRYVENERVLEILRGALAARYESQREQYKLEQRELTRKPKYVQ